MQGVVGSLCLTSGGMHGLWKALRSLPHLFPRPCIFSTSISPISGLLFKARVFRRRICTYVWGSSSGAPRSHLALPAALWLRPSPSPFLIIPELPADSMLLFLVQVFHTYLLLSPRRVGRRRSFSWEPLSLGFFAPVILVFFLSSPGPFSSLQPLHVGVVESLALCASPPACSFSWAISPTSVAL